jgi:hypothetical protein
MNHAPLNNPLPMAVPTEAHEPELGLLLSEPFAAACAAPPQALARLAQPLRDRLAQRVAASLKAEAPMHTVRRPQAPRQPVWPGVVTQTLYEAHRGGVSPQPVEGSAAAQPIELPTLRPGEPVRARLIELAAGVSFHANVLWAGLSDPPLHREWLVLSGSVCLNGQWLSQRDYHRSPADHDAESVVSSTQGALLFLREAFAPLPAPLPIPSQAPTAEIPHTVLDAQAGWPDFAPGIQRRVLWQQNGQAALLYWAQPGAQVPQHRHGHDDECLVLQGELFLDDVLLQPGDYQLAPAGSGHLTTQTHTGAVIYAHGDLQMNFAS